MKTYKTLLCAGIAALGLAACSALDTTDYSSGSSGKGMTGSSGDEAAGESINANMATGSPANGEVNRISHTEDSVQPDPSQR